jgi:hypothetical protein
VSNSIAADRTLFWVGPLFFVGAEQMGTGGGATPCPTRVSGDCQHPQTPPCRQVLHAGNRTGVGVESQESRDESQKEWVAQEARHFLAAILVTVDTFNKRGE